MFIEFGANDPSQNYNLRSILSVEYDWELFVWSTRPFQSSYKIVMVSKFNTKEFHLLENNAM
jgi:hypothetical protein